MSIPKADRADLRGCAVHSFDHYDRVTGISVYRSPAVHADEAYLYFDPVDLLPAAGRERWADPDQHKNMVAEAVEAAGCSHLKVISG